MEKRMAYKTLVHDRKAMYRFGSRMVLTSDPVASESDVEAEAQWEWTVSEFINKTPLKESDKVGEFDHMLLEHPKKLTLNGLDSTTILIVAEFIQAHIEFMNMHTVHEHLKVGIDLVCKEGEEALEFGMLPGVLNHVLEGNIYGWFFSDDEDKIRAIDRSLIWLCEPPKHLDAQTDTLRVIAESLRDLRVLPGMMEQFIVSTFTKENEFGLLWCDHAGMPTLMYEKSQNEMIDLNPTEDENNEDINRIWFLQGKGGLSPR